MSFYEERILPYLVHVAMRQGALMEYRRLSNMAVRPRRTSPAGKIASRRCGGASAVVATSIGRSVRSSRNLGFASSGWRLESTCPDTAAAVDVTASELPVSTLQLLHRDADVGAVIPSLPHAGEREIVARAVLTIV